MDLMAGDDCFEDEFACMQDEAAAEAEGANMEEQAASKSRIDTAMNKFWKFAKQATSLRLGPAAWRSESYKLLPVIAGSDSKTLKNHLKTLHAGIFADKSEPPVACIRLAYAMLSVILQAYADVEKFLGYFDVSGFVAFKFLEKDFEIIRDVIHAKGGPNMAPARAKSMRELIEKQANLVSTMMLKHREKTRCISIEDLVTKGENHFEPLCDFWDNLLPRLRTFGRKNMLKTRIVLVGQKLGLLDEDGKFYKDEQTWLADREMGATAEDQVAAATGDADSLSDLFDEGEIQDENRATTYHDQKVQKD